MPIGLNRTDLNNTGITYNEGLLISEPVNFGNVITEPVNFGNVITEPVNFGNVISWMPNSAHFGNDLVNYTEEI